MTSSTEVSTGMTGGHAPANPPIKNYKFGDAEWRPSRRKVGLLCLIACEAFLFTIFVVAYLFYVGKSLNGPYPKDVLEFPWLASFALLGSSFPATIAIHGIEHGNYKKFHICIALTIALGGYFLGFTIHEWYRFIYVDHFMINTNLFGSTYYALVGLHASHVILGLTLWTLVLVLSLLGKVDRSQAERVQMLEWYWHFVDLVWIIVLCVVYAPVLPFFN